MIDLYYWPTPNGHKITLMLEELADAGAKLEYRIFPVNIGKGDQFKPEFLAITPNHRIPAIIDPDGPGGQRITLFESAAILIYLSEKSGGKLIPADPVGKASGSTTVDSTEAITTVSAMKALDVAVAARATS